MHNARLCEELEAELLQQHEVFISSIAPYAVTSVLSAVAFMESLVNELFQDAVDVEPDLEVGQLHWTTRVSPS